MAGDRPQLPTTASVTIAVHVTVGTSSIVSVHVAIRVCISVQARNTTVEVRRKAYTP